jgi:hypothetical protein
VTTHDLEEKTDEIASWLRSTAREQLRDMGAKGESVIKAHYTKDIVTAQYVELCESLLK